MEACLPKFKVNAVVDTSAKPEEGAVWFFYPLARSKFITEHPELYEGQSGFVVPLFEEECQGRWILADSCAHNLQQGKPPPSTYLADLLRVHQAGFLREYVWWFLGRTKMRTSSQKLQWSTYHTSRANFRSQLTSLRPFTWAQPVIPGFMSCRRACSGV